MFLEKNPTKKGQQENIVPLMAQKKKQIWDNDLTKGDWFICLKHFISMFSYSLSFYDTTQNI